MMSEFLTVYAPNMNADEFFRDNPVLAAEKY